MFDHVRQGRRYLPDFVAPIGRTVEAVEDVRKVVEQFVAPFGADAVEGSERGAEPRPVRSTRQPGPVVSANRARQRWCWTLFESQGSAVSALVEGASR